MKKPTEKIQRIGLVANPKKTSCRRLVRLASRLILQSGRTVVLDEPTARLSAWKGATCPTPAHLSRQVDLLMVFGGDGTMLRVARDTVGTRTPILGINAGGLGFLTDVPAPQLSRALGQVFAGETLLETRAMLEATGQAESGPFRQQALNEFVIGRGAAPRLLDLEVRVDGEVLTCYRCDGVIVSSPTGSTAYSLAAGGAVLSPKADVFALTPICPHTLSNRSVIFGLHSTVDVRVLSRNIETIMTADGQIALPLRWGDQVTVRRSRHVVHLMHMAGSSFFKTLRHKLNWSGSTIRPKT